MGAKTACKKRYNTAEGYVEFTDDGHCPISGKACCEDCEAKVFKYENAE